jgi:2-polyprenyl-3-methyl-5-hydroxy-6-metoxy-1,4-benzoquinol methylase
MDKSKIAVAIFNKRATDYQEKYMNVDLYSESLHVFCDHIGKENADILEMACGPGNNTQFILKKRPDFRILGTDLSPNMIALAQINNPEAQFQLMDCRDIGQINQQYDGIMCGFGLPYLSKEEAIQFIRAAAGLLKPGGILYLSTMEEDDLNKSGIKLSSKGEEMYIYYHQAGYLTEALEENDYTIIYLKHQDYPVTAGPPATDLLIIATRR